MNDICEFPGCKEQVHTVWRAYYDGLGWVKVFACKEHYGKHATDEEHELSWVVQEGDRRARKEMEHGG